MINLKHKVSLYDKNGAHMGDTNSWSLATDPFWIAADAKMDRPLMGDITMSFSDGSYMTMTTALND